MVNLAAPNGHEVPKDGEASLFGFGSAEGSARLGGLLLDLSMEQSRNPPEYALEGEPGYWGVAPASAELKFILPGSDVYEHIRNG